MDYRAALHALQMKMLRAVMVLLHILVHCPEPVLGHILHHLTLRDKLLQIPVYGGDVVIDEDGEFWFIDFNDFPSFSSCRARAAEAIAQRILQR